MRLSLITVTYNAERTIGDTLASVAAQTFEELEYIVIDGASTDGTLDVVRRHEGLVDILISEPDRGIYDAMNKGVASASGDLVGILNSDDFYPDADVLSDVVAAASRGGVDGVYGDLAYVEAEQTSRIVRRWRSGPYRPGSFRRGWMPPHPTFFIRREWYERHGAYSREMGSAADYELMLRMIHKEGARLAYLPRCLVHMRAGGESNASLRHRIAANRQDARAWVVNGLPQPRGLRLLKPARKLLQYLHRGVPG